MSDTAQEVISQKSSENLEPIGEEGTAEVIDELALYRKRKKEELLQEVNAIIHLRANVNSRIFTSIINSACNQAYC